MKVAIFSDLHVHTWQEFSVNDDRLFDCSQVIADISMYCEDHCIEHVWFLGDLYQVRSPGPPTKAVVRATAEIAHLSTHTNIIAVPGNHDQPDRSGRSHALTPLETSSFVTCPGREGQTYPFSSGVVVAALPYCAEPTEFLVNQERLFSDIPAGMTKVLLAHHGFKDARVGSFLEYAVPEPVDGGKLCAWDFVWSGHYHTHQPIVGKTNAYYVGSPLEHKRGDGNEFVDKGFIVFDTDRLTFERIPLDRPKFVTITEEEWEEDSYKCLHRGVGNFVDLVGSAAWLPSATRDMAHSARAVKPVVEKVITKAKKRTKVTTSTNPVESIRQYTKYKSKEIRSKGLDAKRLRRLGRRLYQEAQES